MNAYEIRLEVMKIAQRLVEAAALSRETKPEPLYTSKDVLAAADDLYGFIEGR